jgi:methylated-DNA-[protein]-cysteine S-methyltransferase
MPTKCVNTEYGRIGIESQNGQIVRIWLPNESDGISSGASDPLLDTAADQIVAFLNGSMRVFSLEISPKGTPFYLKVWDALREIPYGETTTYGALAAKLGRPKAYRAVGLACGKNPIPLIIPCHRVVGANGLTGYRGGLDMKKRLLEMEHG